MKAFILLSGGIDLMACINFYRDLGYDVECIFCDYGQPAATIEMQASQKIAEYYHIPYKVIAITNIDIPKSGEICGRNALLVWTAFCKIGFGTYKIILGIHTGTSYPDCSLEFVNVTNRVLDLYTGGTVILEATFIRWQAMRSACLSFLQSGEGSRLSMMK